ncbi:MAG: DUF4391 domain-containing protein [Bacteroidaceae bacterium]|nr:DUF4391 domain-containing protein [Bacteroidaceae bacterium]
MYGLPHTTEVRKQLPKKAIYAKFDLKPSQRESFDADIARIDIVAVVSTFTVPALSTGTEVKEFYLLAVQLKRKEYDSKNIALLTKLIPQKMVLALHYNDEVQFAVHHTKLITSEWQLLTSNSSFLIIKGLTLDTVWENIVTHIGQIEVTEGNTLTEQITANDQRAKVLAQIATLERKMANEKQPRRKRELFEQIKRLRLSIK